MNDTTETSVLTHEDLTQNMEILMDKINERMEEITDWRNDFPPLYAEKLRMQNDSFIKSLLKAPVELPRKEQNDAEREASRRREEEHSKMLALGKHMLEAASEQRENGARAAEEDQEVLSEEMRNLEARLLMMSQMQ